MATQRLNARRIGAILCLLVLSLASAQTRVSGTVGPCAQVAPADLVAEARAGLAWFPFEVGRGTVGADGAFALQFHERTDLPLEVTVAATQLLDAVRCDGLALSAPDARLVVVRELRIIPRGAPCEYCETLGRLYAATVARGGWSSAGQLEVAWIHADRPLTVEGACRYGWGEETYSLSLESGWNTVVFETVFVHPSDGYCDCRDVLVSVQPFPAANVAWHFVDDR
jgi:hypothetical protein